MNDDYLPEEPSLDERIVLMQRYVDLDNEVKRMKQEQEFLEKKIREKGAEFRKVSETLRNRLGYEDPMAVANRSLEGGLR